MENKRDRRRAQREKEFGPERVIISQTFSVAHLECGHVINNPPVSATVNMRPPKFYRCAECNTLRAGREPQECKETK